MEMKTHDMGERGTECSYGYIALYTLSQCSFQSQYDLPLKCHLLQLAYSMHENELISTDIHSNTEQCAFD